MKNKLILNIQKFADDNTVNLKIKQQKEGNAIEETAKELTSLDKIAKSIISVAGFKKIAAGIVDVTKKSADYIESLNVLDVAFNNNTEDIRRFTGTIAETLNLDDSTLIKTASSFKTLANSMNFTNEVGTEFSKLFTQITTDVSSLYNLDFDRTRAMLQTAVMGQGKALKQTTGASVLESTVQTTLDVLGIDAYVKDMNDAEKAMARTIAITYQLRNAQGDLARTIESPANQFRVLGEQISLAGRNIGNIFLPMMAAILPYVNAVIIVINKLLSALANLFGFSETAWDVDVDTESIAESFENLGGAVGGVGDAAESTKKKLLGLRGFDKLNVIKTPSDSGGSGGGGGGGAGGINPNLLNAFGKLFGNYNSQLDGIKTKAQEIADKFFLWAEYLRPLEEPLKNIAGLAFDGLVYVWENVLVPLGKWIGFKLIPQLAETLAPFLQIIYEVGQNLFKIYKLIYENITLPFARTIGGTILKLLQYIGDALEFIANNKILTNILSLYVAFKQLKTVFSLISKTKIGKYFGDALDLIFKNEKGVLDLKNSWKNFLTVFSPSIKKYENGMTTMQKVTTKAKNVVSSLKTALAGFATAVAGFAMFTSALDDIRKNGPSIGNIISTLAGALLAMGGAIVTLNAIFPIFGETAQAIGTKLLSNPIFLIAAAIGAITVAIIGIASAADESSPSIDNLNKSYDDFHNTIKEVNKSLEDSKDALRENYEIKLAELENAPTYIDALYELVDANGKVTGSTQAAKEMVDKINEAYGTNITIEDGVIKNGEDIVKTKDDMTKITDDYIESIKKQIYWEGYQSLYKDAIDRQTEAKTAYNKITKENQKAIEDATKKLENEEITAEEAAGIINTARENQIKAVDDYNDILGETNKIIDGLDDVTHAYATGSTEDLQKAIGEIAKSSDERIHESENTLNTSYQNLSKSVSKAFDETERKGGALSDTLRKIHDNWRNKNLNWSMDLDTSGAKRAYNNFVGNMASAVGAASIDIKLPSMMYAQGGLPSVGQMFIANERGPELVGQIGGQSFVANQNQMMDIIDKKLSNAGGLQNATFIVQVGDETVATKVLKDLNSMAQANGKPITIGG